MPDSELKTEANKVEGTIETEAHKAVALAKHVWATSDLAIVGVVALLLGVFVGHHIRF